MGRASTEKQTDRRGIIRWRWTGKCVVRHVRRAVPRQGSRSNRMRREDDDVNASAVSRPVGSGRLLF